MRKYFLTTAAAIAIATPALAADLSGGMSGGYISSPSDPVLGAAPDNVGLGGEISVSFEDSGYFDDQHYLFDLGGSYKFDNNLIVQLDAQYSNYSGTDYPVIDVDFLFGYQFSEMLSAAALVNYQDFYGFEYWSAGLDTKFSFYQFDVEWGAKVYLTEDGGRRTL